MRLSTSEGDPGFISWLVDGKGNGPVAQGLLRCVTVDGHLVRDVVVADEEAGYVEHHVRYPNGDFAVAPGDGDRVRMRKYGHVRIEWTDAGLKALAFHGVRR